jgi:CO dehydrogenase nickel-insertion accessory protein CooC1
MIIAFLGKGGSGKSTLSTQMSLFLHSLDLEVLAIDADHNLDLSYNLQAGKTGNSHYLGTAMLDIKKYLGLNKLEKYDQIFFQKQTKFFNFGKQADEFSQKYSQEIKEKLFIMSIGEQTEEVLYGKACSHILGTALKLYLPLLQLSNNQAVIVDEKAGADGVSTGIVTGVDLAVITIEPALHSLKTAQQLMKLLNFYHCPYLLVANKIKGKTDINFIEKTLEQSLDLFFPLIANLAQDPFTLQYNYIEKLKNLQRKALSLNNNDRLERTINKFKNNSSFNTN